MGQLNAVNNNRVCDIDDALVVGALCVRQNHIHALAHALAHILDFGDGCGLQRSIGNGEAQSIELDALHLVHKRGDVAVCAGDVRAACQLHAGCCFQVARTGELHQLVVCCGCNQLLDGLDALVHSGGVSIQIHGDVKAADGVCDDRDVNIVAASAAVLGRYGQRSSGSGCGRAALRDVDDDLGSLFECLTNQAHLIVGRVVDAAAELHTVSIRGRCRQGDGRLGGAKVVANQGQQHDAALRVADGVVTVALEVDVSARAGLSRQLIVFTACH